MFNILILILIRTIINIKLTTAQRLTFPDHLEITSCTLYYDVGNSSNVGPYSSWCSTGSPCDCNVPPFNSLFLNDENIKLSDNSWIDFTVRLRSSITYKNHTRFIQSTYLLSSITFRWDDPSQPADATKSFISLFDVSTNDWVNATYSQSNYSGTSQTAMTADYGPELAYLLVNDVRVHIEWNTPTPEGLINPIYFGIYGRMKPSQLPLRQVSLDGLYCCDAKDINSYYWYQTYTSSYNETQSSYIDCCYGDTYDGYSVSGNTSASGVIMATCTFHCGSSNALSFFRSDPSPDITSFNPDIETFCGVDQFIIDYQIPQSLNISISAWSLWNISISSLSVQCFCSFEYLEFIWNNDGEFRCSNGNNNNNNNNNTYCLSPDGITGYVDYFSAVDSVDDSYCDCNYTFTYLEWDIGPLKWNIISVDQRFWNDISWDTHYLTNNSLNDSCLAVKVKYCNDNKQCDFVASYQSVDTAMSYFQTGDYLQSLSTYCYCYQMYNECITTSEPTTFEPTSFAPTTSQPTTTSDESSTAKLTQKIDDKSDAFKVEDVLRYSTLILIFKYMLN